MRRRKWEPPPIDPRTGLVENTEWPIYLEDEIERYDDLIERANKRWKRDQAEIRALTAEGTSIVTELNRVLDQPNTRREAESYMVQYYLANPEHRIGVPATPRLWQIGPPSLVTLSALAAQQRRQQIDVMPLLTHQHELSVDIDHYWDVRDQAQQQLFRVLENRRRAAKH